MEHFLSLEEKYNAVEVAELKKMKELAEKHPGFGLRTLHEITKREKFLVNHKRTERIYKEEK